MNLDNRRSTVNKRLAELAVVQSKIADERLAIVAIEAKEEAVDEAIAIAQAVAQQVQNHAHAQISSIVTQCLEAVFDEPYVFQIHFERKRGRTEARLAFERDGHEVDPLDGSGGGVVDVAAFALRIACLSLARPPLRRVLILDEPFRFAQRGLPEKICALLQMISEKMNFQIIMVTNDPRIRVGKIIRLS